MKDYAIAAALLISAVLLPTASSADVAVPGKEYCHGPLVVPELVNFFEAKIDDYNGYARDPNGHWWGWISYQGRTDDLAYRYMLTGWMENCQGVISPPVENITTCIQGMYQAC